VGLGSAENWKELLTADCSLCNQLGDSS
jgi:hypothetical protein